MMEAELFASTHRPKVDSVTLWLVLAFGTLLVLAVIASKDMSLVARLTVGLFGLLCVCIALIGLLVVPHT